MGDDHDIRAELRGSRDRPVALQRPKPRPQKRVCQDANAAEMKQRRGVPDEPDVDGADFSECDVSRDAR